MTLIGQLSSHFHTGGRRQVVARADADLQPVDPASGLLSGAQMKLGTATFTTCLFAPPPPADTCCLFVRASAAEPILESGHQLHAEQLAGRLLGRLPFRAAPAGWPTTGRPAERTESLRIDRPLATFVGASRIRTRAVKKLELDFESAANSAPPPPPSHLNMTDRQIPPSESANGRSARKLLSLLAAISLAGPN